MSLLHARHPSNQYLVNSLCSHRQSLLSRDPSSKVALALSKAVTSLCKFPLPILSGKEARKLEGIGTYTADKIDGWIMEQKKSSEMENEFGGIEPGCEKEEGGSEIVDVQNKAEKKRKNKNHEEEEIEVVKKARARKQVEYVPKYGSAAYAVLLTLLEAPEYSLSKLQIIEGAKRHSDVEMAPSASSHYAGWSSMSILKEKGFVVSKLVSRKAIFTLTESGIAKAQSLLGFANENSNPFPHICDDKNEVSSALPSQNAPCLIINQPVSSQLCVKTICAANLAHDPLVPTHSSQLDELVSYEPVPLKLPFSNFDIFLFLDNREQGVTRDRHEMQNNLVNSGIRCLTAALALGDMCWIARPKQGGQDIMLNCIVERKKVSDLERSIIDGRYKEQKIRLSLCGLSRIFYLVEGDVQSLGSDEIRIKQMQSAITATECCDSIPVFHSSSVEGTTRILKHITNLLIDECKRTGVPNFDKVLYFSEFQQQSKKNNDLTPTMIFAMQLRMIRGLGAEKALAVAEKYESLGNLMRSFAISANGETMLNGLETCDGARISKQLSSKIYHFFHDDAYNDNES